MTLEAAMTDVLGLVDAIADDSLRRLQTDLIVSELDLDADEIDSVLTYAMARWTFERGILADRVRAVLAQTGRGDGG